jgi:hypothetical protein
LLDPPSRRVVPLRLKKLHVHARVQIPLQSKIEGCTIPPVKSKQRRTTNKQPSQGRRKAAGNVVPLLGVVLMLMGFTIVAVVLAQPTLAAITGTTCVSLSREIVRHLIRRPA